MNEERKELMELRHEPVPGYKKFFFIVFAVGILYLAAVFVFGSHLY